MQINSSENVHQNLNSHTFQWNLYAYAFLNPLLEIQTLVGLRQYSAYNRKLSLYFGKYASHQQVVQMKFIVSNVINSMHNNKLYEI